MEVAAVRDLTAAARALGSPPSRGAPSLEERGILTPELRQAVEGAETLTRLEDVYLPYRPKKRNRATIAEEKGLAPLAERLLQQRGEDPVAMAAAFVDPDKGVASPEDALQGARDIIARMASEDLETREAVRRLYRRDAVYDCRVIPGKEEEGRKFRDWFAWREPVAKPHPHRFWP